ncbi:hypothetical protein NFI96_018347 [Prochilodus magdalenae]|nr:hypothetical protein NFI96_018347 [Prochilodus magdalenae]
MVLERSGLRSRTSFFAMEKRTGGADSPPQCEDRKINPQVSLYLLSQVFLIIHYQPLVNALADVILNGDLSVFAAQPEQNTHKNSDPHSKNLVANTSNGGAWSLFLSLLALLCQIANIGKSNAGVRRFTKPPESLERSLEMSRQRGRKKTQKRPNYKNVGEEEEEDRGAEEGTEEEKAKGTEASSKASRTSGDTEEIEMVVMEKCKISDVSTLTEQNITDEEKTAAAAARTEGQRSRPFLDMVYNALDCEKEDYHALFVLCLLFAMSHSKGINPELLEKIQLPVPDRERSCYSQVLVERLIRIMNQAAQPDGRVRLATLELCCLLLKQSVLSSTQCIIKDVHLACLEGAREESLHLLRRFYKASFFQNILEHPHTVPADGAVGVEVEGHQAFWTCDDKPFILALTTVPPHTGSLGVSTKTKAGLSCVVQPSADGAALTGRLMEDTTARWRSVTVAVGSVRAFEVSFSEQSEFLRCAGEEIFLDMFEDEYRSMTSKPLNVEYLMMDASILLPPTGTPLTGIDFVKRLPCGDVEKTRRAIRVFFMLRALSLQLQGEPETQLPLTRPEDLIKTDDVLDLSVFFRWRAIRVFFMLRALSLQLQGEPETQLPLTRPEDLIKTDDVLDLNNSDLIACMVVSKDGVQAQRFLAVDVYQMSLVEPDTKRLGWGVVKFAGLLQDMQVSGVEDDSRALNITIHKPTSNPHAKPLPILQASFIFADHIRCIIAKQRLAKGRIQARRMKMQRIAALLDLPVQPSSEVLGFSQSTASSSQLPFRFYDQARRGPAFASVDKVPVPADGAVGVEVEGHQAFWTCDYKPFILVLTTVPPHTDSLGVSTKTKAGLVTEDDPLPFHDSLSCVVQPSADGAALTGCSWRTPLLAGGFAVAHVAQHSPSALCSASPSSSSSAGHCDSVTTSSASTAQSTAQSTSASAPALAPSLTPAAQPTISLLSDADAETLSVDSLTLLPPADPPRLRSFSSQSSVQEEAPNPTQDEDSNPDEASACSGQSLEDNTENPEAEDRKDITVIPEEDESSPDSEPADSREEVETRAESIPQPDSEENPDLEQETEID